jgi:hypothetical protein
MPSVLPFKELPMDETTNEQGLREKASTEPDSHESLSFVEKINGVLDAKETIPSEKLE